MAHIKKKKKILKKEGKQTNKNKRQHSDIY